MDCQWDLIKEQGKETEQSVKSHTAEGIKYNTK